MVIHGLPSGVTNEFSQFLKSNRQFSSTYLEGKNQVAKAKSAAAIVSIKADADVKVAGAKAAHKLANDGQTQDFNLRPSCNATDGQVIFR